MMFSKIASVVGSAAPLLGTVLGTPLAGVAVSLIANAFGVKSNDVNEIVSAISNDPASAIKLKEIELKHEETLAQIAATNFQIEFEDRKHARDSARQGSYDWFVHLFATFVTCGFFGSVYFLFTTSMDASDREILDMMLGVLGTTWVQITSYYYGNIKKS
jgi:hypothetical protein